MYEIFFGSLKTRGKKLHVITLLFAFLLLLLLLLLFVFLFIYFVLLQIIDCFMWWNCINVNDECASRTSWLKKNYIDIIIIWFRCGFDHDQKIICNLYKWGDIFKRDCHLSFCAIPIELLLLCRIVRIWMFYLQSPAHYVLLIVLMCWAVVLILPNEIITRF